MCPSGLKEDRLRLQDVQLQVINDDCCFYTFYFYSIFPMTGKILHEEHVELLMEEFAFLKKEVVGKELLKGSLLFTCKFQVKSQVMHNWTRMPARFFSSSLICERGFISAKDSLIEGQFNFFAASTNSNTCLFSIFPQM